MSTWVLLRGLMRETRHWGDFPQLLKKRTAAQNVVLLDLPGNGVLHLQASLSSIPDLAQYCRDSLAGMGYAPPYHVLAISLGGMVAVAWSELAPQEIERLVLINTSLQPYSPFYHRLRPGNYPVLLWNILFGSASGRERMILHVTSNIARCSPDGAAILERWSGYARDCPVLRSNALRQLTAAVCYRAPSSRPPVPVLLLASRNDRLVNVKCSQALAQSWQCAIRVHAQAGHDLPLDDGAWVMAQINAWTQAET